MKINTQNMKWTRAPKQYTITAEEIEIITEPHTDLWQRTYYHFRNDNALFYKWKQRISFSLLL